MLAEPPKENSPTARARTIKAPEPYVHTPAHTQQSAGLTGHAPIWANTNHTLILRAPIASRNLLPILHRIEPRT